MKRKSLALFCMVFCVLSWAADHKEAPAVEGLPGADIADLYAWVTEEDQNLVLAMTVNPFSVPVENPAFNFSPGIRYRFLIDNDGDAHADHHINFIFNPDQSYTMTMGDIELSGNATAPTLEVEPNPPSVAQSEEGIRVFAGQRDDPFFFDFVGFARTLSGSATFTGTDSFAGFNVSAIVVELPSALVLGDGSVLNVWATTEFPIRRAFKRDNHGASTIPDRFLWDPLDRMGNPAVATALIPSDLRDAYNQGEPEDDAEDFAGFIVETLTALGTSADNIGVLAAVAVPDLLTIDVSQPTAFPNGRAPADDVVDTLFFYIFNGADITDGVDANDREFSAGFPYLAAPWQP